MSQTFAVICFSRLCVTVYCKKWADLLKSSLWIFTKCYGMYMFRFGIRFQYGYEEYLKKVLEEVIKGSPHKWTSKTP